MFDIGFWELALIFVLAVIVFGPERLPDLARKAGRFAARGRAMMHSLQAQLEEEVDFEERKKQGEVPAPDEPPPAAIESKPETAPPDEHSE
jgi:Tat protein translocase TatB subunit